MAARNQVLMGDRRTGAVAGERRAGVFHTVLRRKHIVVTAECARQRGLAVRFAKAAVKPQAHTKKAAHLAAAAM